MMTDEYLRKNQFYLTINKPTNIQSKFGVVPKSESLLVGQLICKKI